MGTTDFDEFWAAYPRRIAKGDARKAWERASRLDPELLEKCLKALVWQRVSEQWTKDGGQFIPYPATWLRAERWEDENPYEARLAKAHHDMDAKLRDWYAQWVKAQPAGAEPVSFEGWKYAMEQRRRA